jgi:hypothetical protein
MNCVGGGELKLLRISTAFAGIRGRILPGTSLSESDRAYIVEQVASIRRDWRVTDAGERFFTLLASFQESDGFPTDQYLAWLRPVIISPMTFSASLVL